MMKHVFLFILAFGVALLTSTAWAGDSHAEYYYPIPVSSEVYASPSSPLPNTTKRTRIGFTVGLNARQRKRAYPPQYHIFAKGKWAQKLIIVASGDGRYNTLYRLRALMAGLSADARTSPLFQQTKAPENLNFLDLARMVGFSKITLSDGDKFAHRIDIR